MKLNSFISKVILLIISSIVIGGCTSQELVKPDLQVMRGEHSYFLSSFSRKNNKGYINLGMAVAISSINNQCYLLTNAHITSDVGAIFVSQWSGGVAGNGIRHKAEVIWEEAGIDAVIIVFPIEGGCSTAKVAEKTPKLGMEIFTFGQPIKDHGALTKGIVGGFWNIKDQGVLMISDLFVVQGNSGAGVFSVNNELVGLVTGMTSDRGYAYIIPLCRLLPLLWTIGN